ncbi:MAG: tetratricopeptide repeat protein [Thermodesulfobacteriota bacterium]
MKKETDIVQALGYPENPIEILRRIARLPLRSAKQRRRRLVAVQMIVTEPEFRVHPTAWRRYLQGSPSHAQILPESPSAPSGWPVPVYLESAGCGGVAHVHFETGGLQRHGHRLDISGPMEAFLLGCSEVREGAFPDSHRFPFAARIRPGLRLYGRSWELPCLVGYFSTHSGRPVRPVFATGSIEADGSLKPGDKLEQKVEGWLREVGPGTTAVLLRVQEEPLRHLREKFEEVRIIEDISDLIVFFRDRGWLEPHQEKPDRVRCERCLKLSQEWYQSGRPKMALLTLQAIERHRDLLLPRQEIVWLGGMHFLLSCFGRFGEGLGYLDQMKDKLSQCPGVLTRDEEAIHLAKAAVQLYDSHRFQEAEELLRPLVDPKMTQGQISRVCRAKVLGTLGQVLTARKEFEEAASLLHEAIEIFQAMDPLEVSRAYHYLIHNRLRAADVQEAERLLEVSQRWLEEADIYGALFREAYHMDLCRRRSQPCRRPCLPQGYLGLVHPYCFALQAWARNESHPLEERIGVIREAAQKMEANVPGEGGVLEFLGLAYRIYEACLTGDASLLRDAWQRWGRWIRDVGRQGFTGYYSDFLSQGPPDHAAVEALMDRIPYH